MDIRDMDMLEISDKLKPYIATHFKGSGSQLVGLDNGVFQEAYRVGYDEVMHLISEEYQSRFCDADMFTGFSGYVELAAKDDAPNDIEYIAMLLATEDCANALFLYIQETLVPSTEIQNDILIADFMKAG